MLQVERKDRIEKYDSLTGLPNAEFFLESGYKELQRQSGTENIFAVHLLYIDNMKDIIMDHGLHVGESALKGIANRLYGVLDSNRVFARLEGERFGILQQDVEHVGHATYVARRIMETLKAPVEAIDFDVALQVSIGIALYPAHAKDWDGLYANALLALEQARKNGGARYVMYGV